MLTEDPPVSYAQISATLSIPVGNIEPDQADGMEPMWDAVEAPA